MYNLRAFSPALLALGVCLAGLACRTPLPQPGADQPAGDPAPISPGRADAGTPDRASEVTAPPVAVDGGSADLQPADITARPEVLGPDAAEVGQGEVAASNSGCGSERPDMSQVVGADGLAIDRAGTIYFTQSAATDTGVGHVGRMRLGSAPEPTWLSIPAGARLWGLTLDESRGRLYVLAAQSKTIHYVEVGGVPGPPGAGAPALRTLATGLEEPNDIAVGSDGHVYYSAERDRQVYRLSPAGVKSVVTTSPTHVRLAPAGLTFARDGTLLVGTAGIGPILRLTLAGGTEQSRRAHGHLHTWGNGLALDSRGRLYVVTYSPTRQAQVVMIVEDESAAVQVADGAGFGSLAWGRGPLDCRDLYIAVPTGPLLRLATDVPGRL